MIVKEEFIKRLRSAFDLNIYEVKIWTALLSKGIATAGELSDMSNVPRSRSYDVLESLEKKGFIIMKLGRPIKYLAVKPSEIIKIAAPLKSDKAKEAAKEIKEYAEVKDVDLNSRFIIVDGKDLLFLINSDKSTHESAEVAIWVNT